MLPHILYNCDTNFLMGDGYGQPAGEPYTIQTIYDYVDLLAGSGVEACLINANAQVPWYPSRIGHVITGYRRGDREFVRHQFPPCDEQFTPAMLDERIDTTLRMLDRLLDLLEAGVDWLQAMAAHCRQRGLSPWASIRMNDAHGANNWDRSYMNCPPQRQPRFRLSGRIVDPTQPAETSRMLMDYRHQAVRDYMFSMIREQIEDYDLDGMELDWVRCPFCCEPPADETTIATMTAWIGEIRKLADQRARQTGRPFHLGVRCPVRLALLRDIGMDVIGWAQQGLIDFVSPSNFWQTTWDVPYEQLRAQLPKNVALIGIIDDAPNWLDARSDDNMPPTFRRLSASADHLRANAAGKLASGVDAVELYNFFCTDSHLHRQKRDGQFARYDVISSLGDLDPLRGTAKHYTLATQHGHWQFREFEYAEQVPFHLAPRCKQPLRLSMCREPVDANLSLFAQVVFDRTNSDPALGVSLNGGWPTFTRCATDRLLAPCGPLTRHLPQHQACNMQLPIKAIVDGCNELLLFNESDELLHIRSVELAVM